MKIISHLVAVSNNLVIGVDNDLPWNLKADLAHFKKYTLDKIIIMGRKTYESIGRHCRSRPNYPAAVAAPLRSRRRLGGLEVRLVKPPGFLPAGLH